MTEAQVTALLDERSADGIRPGLSRMRAALSALGDPQEKLKVVHIAGTNGKGSTAQMIACIAREAGLRTGLYTSPSVTGLRDTISVDGNPISAEAFGALAKEIAALPTENSRETRLSAFEFVTVLALLHFARSQTALCIIECGLGGRQDATNVFSRPLAAVITDISLDHTAFLGDTAEAIAREKCGIIHGPCAVVTVPQQDDRALAAIFEAAAEQQATVHLPGAVAVTDDTPGTVSFTMGGEPYTLSLTGAVQARNASCALTVCRCLREQGLPIADDAMRRGLARVQMPCRQEILRREPLLLLDGAHNPQGVAALAQTLKTLPRPITAVFGMLRDKDTAACADMLCGFFDRVVCTTPPSPRALPAADLAAQCGRCADVRTEEDPAAAWELAVRLSQNGGLAVIGSFYLAADLRDRALALLA